MSSLTPQEWKSGDAIWVVEAIGPPKIVQALLARLQKTKSSATPVKIRTRGKDGKPTLAQLVERKRP